MNNLFCPALACVAVMFVTGTSASQTVSDPALIVEQVAPLNTFNQPTCMAFIGPNELLVGEKASGQVWHILNGVKDSAPALDLSVNSESERGLLSLALDPDFATNKYVYFRFVRADRDGGTALDQQIHRYTWNGSALVDKHAVNIALPINPGPNHNGGPILFGPPTSSSAEQKIFGVVGDLNREHRTENFRGAINPDDSGSIFRVNRDGTNPSGDERGPFYDVAGSNINFQRLFAYGIRNSFGLDFDPVTGNLWDTENGPDRFDEINLVQPGSNSGWKRVMGPSSDPDSVTSGMGLENLDTLQGVGVYSEPEFSWKQVIAPTAIHFLRSSALGSQYLDTVFVGCNNNGNLYHFTLNDNRDGFQFTDTALQDNVLDTTVGDTDNSIVFGTGFPVVTALATGPDGFLYVLSLSNGTIYRIRPKDTRVDNWMNYDN